MFLKSCFAPWHLNYKQLLLVTTTCWISHVVNLMADTITTQPGSNKVNDLTPVAEYGPIKIRHLTATPDDCKFAGQLTIEAFRDKFIHATSERR